VCLPDTGDNADQAESPAKKAHGHCSEPENVPPSRVRDRDKDFYFDDGDLIFRVERTLFKVCRLLVPLGVDSVYQCY
jgi:hypothetical protein